VKNKKNIKLRDNKMISEHELRKRQSEFEGTRQEMRKEFEKGDSERSVIGLKID
jgi:hypothetical protein